MVRGNSSGIFSGSIDISDPRQLLPSNFLALSSITEKLKQLIGYAVLAPSAHNTQPWLFRIVDHSIEIFADRSRALAVIDADDKGLLLSCGTCAGVLAEALEATGFEFKRSFLPDPSSPDLIARFRITEEKKPGDTWIQDLNAIRLRRSVRAGFQHKVLPETSRQYLFNRKPESGVQLILWDDLRIEAEVLALVTEAEKTLSTDKHYQRENTSWINPIRARTHDGIPTDATQLAPFDTVWSPSGTVSESGERMTFLGAIITQDDRPMDWIKGGSLLADSLLQASKQGISAALTSHLLAGDHIKDQFQSITGCDGYVQVLFRYGYGHRSPMTPRRPIHEVMLQPGYTG